MPRIQGKVCTVEVHWFFPNSVGLSDGARQNERPAQTSSKAWCKHCRREADHAVPREHRRRAEGVKQRAVDAQLMAAFHAAARVSTELCCSPRPLWLPVMLLCLSREVPCLLGSMQLCPSHQAGGTNCLAAFHRKSYPLCSKRYTLDQ